MNMHAMRIGRKQIKKAVIPFLFLLPNLFGFFIFKFIPVLQSFYLSLCEWNGVGPYKFVGLKNYITLLKNDTFRISLMNTLYYSALVVPLTLIMALVLALLLNKGIRGKSFFRSVLFFPHIAPIVAVTVIWTMVFSPDIGPINQFLRSIGIADPPRWLSSPDWAMLVVILVSVWKQMGYYMVIYLAALQGIPSELYEAAAIDGASPWQSFRYITVPSLSPTTFLVMLMLFINSFQSFDLVYVMTKGGPGRATKLLSISIYESAFSDLKYGYASAMAIVLFIIVLLITLVQFKAQAQKADE